MVDVESILTGLILIDVTATLGTAWMLRGQMQEFGERLTKIETQHRHNHRGTEE